jgi:hypothetical protein
MKYITITTHDAWKVAAILFSPQISHADMASKWLNRVVGAGFVTLHDGVPACVGFSTSLNLGPGPDDLFAVKMAIAMTHIEYPAPAVQASSEPAKIVPARITDAAVRNLSGPAQVRFGTPA